MKTSTLIVTLITVLIILPLVAAILTPTQDVVSQVALMLVMAVVCGVLAFIISRFKSFGPTPQSIKRLIIVLVCLLSITTAYSVMSFARNIGRSGNSSPVSSPVSSFGGVFSFGNLWVGSSSGGRGVTVVCSVDSPVTLAVSGGTDLWMLAFPDGNSVEFNIIRNQTVWIDKQHRVTFLGPVLNKEDVSLMRSHGGDVKLTISSPEPTP